MMLQDIIKSVIIITSNIVIIIIKNILFIDLIRLINNGFKIFITRRPPIPKVHEEARQIRPFKLKGSFE